MAETTSTSRTSSTAAKSTARKQATRRTTRSAAAKSPSAATARRTRQTAVKETREAAQAHANAATTTAAQGRNLAERTALVYVGASLEARDRAIELATGLVNRYGSVESTRRELGRDVQRFERRGHTARTRLEHQLRERRRRAERLVRREAKAAEREAERRPNPLTSQLTVVSGRVEDAVQVGVAVSNRIVKQGRERLTALA